MTAVPLSALLPRALAAFVVGVISVPLVSRVAVRLGVVSRPRADRWAGRPVPMLGGLAIFAGTAAGVFSSGVPQGTSAVLLAAAGFMLLVGALDDRFAFRPQTKLVAQILGACLVTGFGIAFAPDGLHSLNIVLSIVWMVAIINAVNLMDNMDGLAAGVSLVSSVFLAVQFAQVGAVYRASLAASLAGGLLAFLLFNFPPARIFMGDAGSLSVGLLLGGLSISNALIIDKKMGAVSVLFGPALVLAVPILDVALVTVTRILRGQSVSQGGRDHSSHRLIRMGLSERKALVVFYGMAVASGLLGMQIAQGIGRLRAMFLVALSWIPLGLFFAWLAKVRIDKADDPGPTGAIGMAVGWIFRRRMMEVAMDLALAYVCFCLAYGLRFDFDLLPEYKAQILKSIPWVLGVTLACFQVTGIYSGFWENYGLRDVFRFGKAAVGSATLCIALAVVVYRYEAFPRSVFPLFGLLLFVSTLGVRTSFQIFDMVLAETGPRKTVILGTGPQALAAFAHLTNAEGRSAVAAFIDPSGTRKSRIYGLPVLSLDDLFESERRFTCDRVICAEEELLPAAEHALRQYSAAQGTLLQRYESRLVDWPTA